MCLCAAAPAPARAWTSTELSSADAHVHLWSSGQALVGLSLALTVRGGWLSRFEVAGLGPGSRLDPDKPPSLLCEDGRKVSPRAELRPDGTLVLEFDRATAPHRGRHRLDLLYATRATSSETGAGTRRLGWSMPAWRVDLADVDLWINAPPAARLAGGGQAELDDAVSRRQLVHGGRTVLHLHRVQLPRTLPFGFEIELPAAAAPAPASLARVQPRGGAGQPAPLWLGAAVWTLAWLKRSAVRARCRRSGGHPVALIALPDRARHAVMLALALAGALAYTGSPPFALALLAAVVALGLDLRIVPLGAAPRARRVGPLAGLHDLFGATSWLDATTLPGGLLIASAFALGVARVMLGGGLGPWLELLLLVTPLWLTATRLHQPERWRSPSSTGSSCLSARLTASSSRSRSTSADCTAS
jgi:hypothetical protein